MERNDIKEMFRRFLELIASKIDQHYFQEDMQKYEQAAWKLKETADKYLKKHGYKFVSGVFPDPESDWPKVDVRIIIFNLPNYDELLKLWDKVLENSYPAISHDEAQGTFLMLDNK